MNKVLTLEERKDRFAQSTANLKPRTIICAGTGCIAGGSMKIYDRFRELLDQRGLQVTLSLEAEEGSCSCGDYALVESGCQGFCQMGPLVTLQPQGILYVKVTLDDVEEIIEKTLLKGEYIERLLYTCPDNGAAVREMEKIPFYSRQQRIMLGLCGQIDVHDLDEYIYHGGYFMARKAVKEMTAEEICTEILLSGLKGRGGGGFPTGRKWDLTRLNESDVKYVICNGDEGDPGAFMDRCVMEGNPHVVLEGMMIAAQAVGAAYGYIYVRMEYPLAVQRLKEAIRQAREAGLLGENIFNSGKSFDIAIKEGAGAFVCGEETALLRSLEGERGMPTPKPPFPAQSGLWGKPTVINNVETYANIPVILTKGAKWFSSIGTATSKGTKVFALTGKVNNSGLVEVPMGTTLREIIYEIGGGIKNGKKFKAVQTGGPSGGCLTEKHLDTPIDYESLAAAGSMMGSGGMIVIDEDDCMVSVAKFYLDFIVEESCGKCVPCRIGNKRLYETLDRITVGKGKPEDIEKLKNLCSVIKDTSLCGLGQTSPNPVLSTLNNFMEEYHEHVYEKKCRSGKCRSLLYYVISEEECIGCMACKRVCPTHAISGEKKEVHQINQEICIKCGACMEKCQFDAIHLQNDYPKVTAII